MDRADRADKVERCGFCGRVREGDSVMVQSPLHPEAIICKSCILFFKEKKEEEAVKQFEEDYRPDEDSRTD